jgi:ribosomal protein L32
MKAAQDLASMRHRLVQQGQLEAHTLFECLICGERQLGQRRCAECQRFCRALGLAATGSACGEPVLLTDLFDLEVPQPT